MRKKRFSIYHLKKFKMWKKSVCLSFIYLMISSVFVVALNAAEPNDQLNYNDAATYNNPTFWTSGKADYANIQWNLVNFNSIPYSVIDKNTFYEGLPADQIGKIPAKEVDVTLVKDKKMLTASQLAYSSNLEKVGDLSKANIGAVNDALATRYSLTGVQFVFAVGVTLLNNKLTIAQNCPSNDPVAPAVKCSIDLDPEKLKDSVISATPKTIKGVAYNAFLVCKKGSSECIAVKGTTELSMDESGNLKISSGNNKKTQTINKGEVGVLRDAQGNTFVIMNDGSSITVNGYKVDAFGTNKETEVTIKQNQLIIDGAAEINGKGLAATIQAEGKATLSFDKEDNTGSIIAVEAENAEMKFGEDTLSGKFDAEISYKQSNNQGGSNNQPQVDTATLHAGTNDGDSFFKLDGKKKVETFQGKDVTVTMQDGTFKDNALNLASYIHFREGKKVLEETVAELFKTENPDDKKKAAELLQEKYQELYCGGESSPACTAKFKTSPFNCNSESSCTKGFDKELAKFDIIKKGIEKQQVFLLRDGSQQVGYGIVKVESTDKQTQKEYVKDKDGKLSQKDFSADIKSIVEQNDADTIIFYESKDPKNKPTILIDNAATAGNGAKEDFATIKTGQAVFNRDGTPVTDAGEFYITTQYSRDKQGLVETNVDVQDILALNNFVMQKLKEKNPQLENNDANRKKIAEDYFFVGGANIKPVSDGGRKAYLTVGNDFTQATLN